ncbi:hypothetical protein C8F04DRAFT_1255644 [Mycena alexandri]|uniref:Uncharacterized protein n=1 Tax=Mycena alexandri TaxID=1745969 RepID=A0AAD6X4J0_9AGAR|nr:hypothetical protein C8F04DRAFT_1255644 [Mycena alexandri]
MTTQRCAVPSTPIQYATRQARILRSLALDFELKWVGMAALIAACRAEVAAAEAEAVAEGAAEAVAAADRGDKDRGDEDGKEGDGADEGSERIVARRRCPRRAAVAGRHLVGEGTLQVYL